MQLTIDLLPGAINDSLQPAQQRFGIHGLAYVIKRLHEYNDVIYEIFCSRG